jgi:hypothetical protein
MIVFIVGGDESSCSKLYFYNIYIYRNEYASYLVRESKKLNCDNDKKIPFKLKSRVGYKKTLHYFNIII